MSNINKIPNANKAHLMFDQQPFKKKDYPQQINKLDFASRCFPLVHIIETSFLRNVILDKLPLFLVESFNFTKYKRVEPVSHYQSIFQPKTASKGYRQIYNPSRNLDTQGKSFFIYIIKTYLRFFPYLI